MFEDCCGTLDFRQVLVNIPFGHGMRYLTWRCCPSNGIWRKVALIGTGVVFVRQADQAYVLDSKKGLRSNRRTDFGRMKPKWSISVT